MLTCTQIQRGKCQASLGGWGSQGVQPPDDLDIAPMAWEAEPQKPNSQRAKFPKLKLQTLDPQSWGHLRAKPQDWDLCILRPNLSHYQHSKPNVSISRGKGKTTWERFCSKTELWPGCWSLTTTFALLSPCLFSIPALPSSKLWSYWIYHGPSCILRLFIYLF